MMQKIWDRLKSYGLPDNSVAGIMGNIKAESDYLPNNVENTSCWDDKKYTQRTDNDSTSESFAYDSFGYGLCQWTYYTRKRKLWEYAQSRGVSIGDCEMQVDFIIKELKEDFSGLWEQLMKGGELHSMSSAFCKIYENPADQSDDVMIRRAEYAMEALNVCAGETMTVTITYKGKTFTGKLRA